MVRLFGQKVTQSFEKFLGIAPVCMKYTKRSDDTDLMLMVNELHKVSVCFYIPGRHQSCFPNFAANLFNSIVALVLFIEVCSLCIWYIYGTVSAKIAPRLKCYKNASRLNRYNFPTDNAIAFLLSTLHTTPLHYEVLKIGSR